MRKSALKQIIAILLCFCMVWELADFSKLIGFAETFNEHNVEIIVDSSANLTYTGEEVCPKVEVKYTKAGVESRLNAETDYTVTYSNNINVTTRAEISVAGKGSYEGTVQTKFTISSKSIDTVTVDPSTIPVKTWSGQPIRPQITSVTDGTTLLELNKDYSISYENNVNPTTVDRNAQLVINGENNYGGTKKIPFDINQKIDITNLSNKKLTVNGIDGYAFATMNYIGSAVNLDTTKLEVRCNGKLIPEDQYRIECINNTDCGTARIQVTILDTSEKYQGVNIANTFQITKNISRMGSSIQLIQDSYTYTGRKIKPKIVATDGTKTLVEDTDYTLSYDKNTDVGAATLASGAPTVIIKGKGDYSEELRLTFTISKKSVEDSDVKFDVAESIFGEDQTPNVEVYWYDGATKIVLYPANYTLSYKDNEDVGEATVTITGTGNAIGTKEVSYNIAGKSIKVPTTGKDDFTVAPIVDCTYTGYGIEPEIVINENGVDNLVLGTDYKLLYEKNRNAGTGIVKITGIGNYTGSRECTFKINQLDFKYIESRLSAVVSNGGTYPYTGRQIRPTVIVTYTDSQSNKVTLTETDDYTLSYGAAEDNINVGNGNVTVNGTGNYKGSISKSFTVTPRDIGSYAEVSIETKFYNAGNAVDATQSDIKVVDADLNKELVYGTDYTIVSCSNNTEITANAVCTLKGLGNYGGTVDKNYSIKKNIADLPRSSDTPEYTGSEITPKIKITDGSYTLAQDEDFSYTVEGNSLLVDHGTYTLKIQASPKSATYAGEFTMQFVITQKNLTGAKDITIDQIANQQYTGTVIRPDALVKAYYNGLEMKLDRDYTVSYISNTRVSGSGETDGATVTIVAKEGGNYSGSIGFNGAFKIVPRSLTNIASIVQNYTVATKMTVTNLEYKSVTDYLTQPSPTTVVCTYMDFDKVKKNISLTEGVDYTLKYRNNNLLGQATVEIVGSGNFEGNVEQSFYISSRLDNDSVKIKEGAVKDYIYTGSEIKPSFEKGDLYFAYGSTSYPDYELAQDVDYTIGATAYENNINANETAEVTDPSEPSEPTEPGATKASVTLTSNETTFAADSTKKIEFNILKKDISNADTEAGLVESSVEYSGFEAEKQYTGNPITQDANVKLTYNGKDLVKDTDYEVTYEQVNNDFKSVSDPKDKSTWIKMKIKGIGNFDGELTDTFSITPRDIAEELGGKVEAKTWTDEFEYSGNAIAQSAGNVESNITYANAEAGMETRTLTFDTDYTVSYEDNTNVGIANAIITGKGNYTGTYKLPFTIWASIQNDAYTAVDPITSVQYTGSPITPKVSIVCGGETLKVDTDYTVTSTNNVEVADASAEINPPTVTITGNGTYIRGTRTATFSIIPKNLSEAELSEEDINVVQGADMVYTGQRIEPNVTVTNHGNAMVKDTDYTISVASGENMISAGLKHATLTAVEGSNYTGSINITYAIAPRDISATGGTVAVSGIDDKKYTGSAITQNNMALTYTNTSASMSGIPMILNSDYTVQYLNNTDAGEATIIFTGKGNYTGIIRRTFTIIGTSFNKAQITVDPVYYTGNYVRPAVKVTLDGKTLEEDKDYTIFKYDNNVNAALSTATNAPSVTIAGMGDYEGLNATATFDITGKLINDTDITEDAIADMEFNGAAMEPKVGLHYIYTDPQEQYQDYTLTEGTDYTLSYKNNIQSGTATVVVTGMGNYSGTREINFKITPISMETDAVVINQINDAVYNAAGAIPTASLTYTNPTTGAKYELIEGTDYTITATNNTAIGDATATITAIEGGSFTGSKTGTFRVVGDLADATTSPIDMQVVTGSEIKPAVTLTYAGKDLVEGTDYTVTYANNVNAGTATVTFTAVPTSYYTGTTTAEFTIAEAIAESMVISGISPSGYTYTQSEITPPVRVMVDDVVLRKDTDYTVTYADNINVGTGKITVTGLGTYTGTKTTTFKIIPKNISVATAEEIAAQTYTGNNITPDVQLKDGTVDLVNETDYTTVYTQNKLAGTASVIVSGKGNYTGSKILRFSITVKKPTSFKASSLKTTSMKLSWSMSGAATGYEVYTSANKLVGKTRSKSFTPTGLLKGKTYKYKVRAYVISDGKITHSGFTSVLTATTLPAIPKVTVTTVKAKQAVISWKRVSRASGYVIYRSTSKKGTYSKVKTITSGSTVSYTNTKLTSNKKYYYKVRAYKTLNGKNVYSSYSAAKSVTIK